MKEVEKNFSKENCKRKDVTTSKSEKRRQTKLASKKKGIIFEEFSMKYLIIILYISALLKGRCSSNITLKIEGKGNISGVNGQSLSEISNLSNYNINPSKKINYSSQSHLNLRKLVSGEEGDGDCPSNLPFKNLSSGECIKYCDINSLILNLCELSYKSGNALYDSFNRSMTDFNINLLNKKILLN